MNINIMATITSLTERLAALATTEGVLPGTARFREVRNKFIVAEFESYFGEESKLANWQKLCTDLGIEGPPNSIKQCRKALKLVHVNIWDLLDAIAAGTTVKTFGSYKALVNYTHHHKKFYPRKKAKSYGAVAALLKHML